MKPKNPRNPRGNPNFVKGNPGSAGRTPLPIEVRIQRSLTKTMVEASLSKYMLLPYSQLKELAKDDSLATVDQIIIRIALHACKSGDFQRLNFLLDRIIGKVKDEPKDVTLNVNQIMSLPREQVIELGREAVRFLEESKE